MNICTTFFEGIVLHDSICKSLFVLMPSTIISERAIPILVMADSLELAYAITLQS